MRLWVLLNDGLKTRLNSWRLTLDKFPCVLSRVYYLVMEGAASARDSNASLDSLDVASTRLVNEIARAATLHRAGVGVENLKKTV